MNRVAASLLVASRVLARGLALVLKAISVLMLRGALSLSLMVCLLHFVISDPICADYVSDLVSRNIPGTLRMQRIHASPLLRDWSVVGLRIYTPEMQPVVQAERVDFLLQRQRFFSWFLGLLTGTSGVELHIDKLKIFNGHVEVDLRDPEHRPLIDTFVAYDEKAARPKGEKSPLWIKLPRVAINGMNISVRTQVATIFADEVEFRGALEVRDESLHIQAQKIRFQRGKIELPISPLIGVLPISAFSVNDVLVTQQELALGSFSARIGEVEVAGRGTLGLDERMVVDAKFRVDTTFNNPLLERLLPLRGDGLVSMVAEVHGGLMEPQVEADLYAEASRMGALKIRQASGRVLFGRDLAGDGLWRYGLPHFRVITQYGSLRISDLSGRMSFDESLEVNGKGLFRLRRLVPLELLDSLGLDVGAARLPRLQVGGLLNLSFQGGDKGWKLAPRLDLGVVVGGRRELSVKGSTTVEISPKGVRISSPDLEIEDASMRLKIDGETKWPGGVLDLSARGEIMKLQEVARPFADLPLRGALENLVVEVSGRLPMPSIRVRGNLRGIRMDSSPPVRGYLDVELRPDGVLEIDLLDAKAEGFDLATKGELQLFEAGSWTLAPKMVLQLRNMRASGDLDAQNFVPELSGEVRLWSRGLAFDLLDPIKSLHGRINMKGKYLAHGAYRIRTLEMVVEGRANQLTVERLHAVLPGGAQLSVEGRIRDFPTHVDLRVKVLDLNLTRILSMAGLSPAEIPLVGFLRADLRISGPVTAPGLHGTVTGMNLRYGDIKLGRVAVGLKPLKNGGAKLVGKEFPPGFTLEDPSVLRLDPEHRQLLLTLGFEGIDPLSWAGVELPENLKKLQVRLQGRSRIHLNLGDEENTEPLIRLWLPENGFSVEGEPLVETLHNPAPIEAWFAEGEVTLPDLQLRYGDAELRACGVVYADGFVEAALRGWVPLQVLTLQRALFSDAKGRAVLRGKDKGAVPAGLLLACSREMVDLSSPPATIQGTFRAALVDAELHLLDGRLSLRGMAQEILLPNNAGFRLQGQIIGGDGVLDFSPLSEEGFDLQFGDGTLSIQGSFRTRNLQPESLELSLRGVGLEVASPRTFRILGSPDLRITGTDLSSPEKRALRAEGVVTISEGYYYRSFDAFARAVGNVFGRKMDAYSRPLIETFPLLKDLGLDLKVRSSAFQVASPFPFGKAELDLDINASVRGTLGRPEVYDIVHVRPGSTIQYSIFGREFEIFEGTIEFRGDPSHPHIELAARTVTTYTEAIDDTSISSRSEGMSIEREESVTITIRITGTYPELDIDFSSDRPEFDEADIQSLIFTGVPARRSGGSGDVLADSSVNLFAEDLTGLLSKLMLTPFLDSVSLGVNRLGGITAEFLTSLGRSMSVKTRVMQVGVDTRFDTGFRVQFSDRVSLEGKLKVLQEEQDQTRSYEAKLKYRIPLDE